MTTWKSTIIGYCIFINVFLVIFGILINSMHTVFSALSCIGLLSLPVLIQGRHEEEKVKKENVREQKKD